MSLVKLDYEPKSFLARRAFGQTANEDQVTVTATTDLDELGTFANPVALGTVGGPTTCAADRQPLGTHQVVSRTGTQLVFIPRPAAHPGYVRGEDHGPEPAYENSPTYWGNGCKWRSRPLKYSIVYRVRDISTTIVIEQDEATVLRQEYLNHDLADMMPRVEQLGPAVPSPAGHYSAEDLGIPSARMTETDGTVRTDRYTLLAGYGSTPPADSPGALADAVLVQFNLALSRDIQVVPLGPGLVPSENTVAIRGGFTVQPGDGTEVAVVTTPTCYPNPPASCDDLYLLDSHNLPIAIAAGPDRIVSTTVRAMPTSGTGVAKPKIASAWRNPERNEAVNRA